MGMLVGGKWVDGEVRTNEKGEFKHQEAAFRSEIAPEDAEGGRYILITHRACPWAHRTAVALHVKGLLGLVEWVEVDLLAMPWRWAKGLPFECAREVPSVEGHPPAVRFLWQLYVLTDPDVTARATVPVLWDKQRCAIVSNESSHILRLLDDPRGLGGLDGGPSLPLFFGHSKEAQLEIERVNGIVYEGLNDGVYKAGMATSDEAHEAGAKLVADTLQKLEDLLAKRPFLAGEALTEADVRCFVTLVRFRACSSAFRCDRAPLEGLPRVSAWLARVYELPAVRATVRGPWERGLGYFFVSKRGRRLGTLVRLVDFVLAELCGTTSPSAAPWGAWLYAALAWPCRLLAGALA